MFPHGLNAVCPAVCREGRAWLYLHTDLQRSFCSLLWLLVCFNAQSQQGQTCGVRAEGIQCGHSTAGSRQELISACSPHPALSVGNIDPRYQWEEAQRALSVGSDPSLYEKPLCDQ